MEAVECLEEVAFAGGSVGYPRVTEQAGERRSENAANQQDRHQGRGAVPVNPPHEFGR